MDGEFIIPLLPGDYLVEAEIDGMISPRQTVSVGYDRTRNLTLVVGDPDWPFYRMGSTVVPFKPRPAIVAIVPQGRHDDDSFNVASVAAESGLISTLDEDDRSLNLRDDAGQYKNAIQLFTKAQVDDTQTTSRGRLRQALGG